MPPAKKGLGAGVVFGIVAAVIFLFVVAGGIGGAIYWLAAKKSSAPFKSVWSDADAAVPVTSDDPVRGERLAPVTIVVFSDFQCPFCKRNEATLDALRARYGKSLRIVWKNNPLAFHVHARPAAEAARGVFELGGNDAFWSFHDQAFRDQTNLDEMHFETWARGASVDPVKMADGVRYHSHASRIAEDEALAKRLGATGTPTAFVNGILVNGAQPIEAFEKIIDDQISAANAKIASGTPADRIYVELTNANYKSAPPAPTYTAPKYEPPPKDTKVYKIPIGSSPRKGPDAAAVTLVAFSDFQCPFCRRAEATLKLLEESYPSDLRFVWKNQPLPFHANAEPAAELALEARAQKGDRAFWAVHDQLFSQPFLDKLAFDSIAKKSGLDTRKTTLAIATFKHKAAIDEDVSLASIVGASGTPTFFLNGRKLSGAQPFEKFDEIIKEELVAAKALLAKGVPASGLYDELQKRESVP